MPELVFGNKFMFVEDVWLDVKQDNLSNVRNLIFTEYLTIGVSAQMIKYYWLLAMEQWLDIKSQIITTKVSSILNGLPILVAFTKAKQISVIICLCWQYFHDETNKILELVM